MAALVAEIGQRLDPAAQAELLPAVRWQAARRLHSCKTVRAEDSATADVQAQATSHRLCLRGPAAELISAAPDNQVIDRVISDDRDSRVVIDRVTSAALANLAIVQPTLVDPDNQAIDQVTSANQADLAIDPATSADPGDPVIDPET